MQVTTSFATALPSGAAGLGQGANALPGSSLPQQGAATVKGPLDLASSAADAIVSAAVGELAHARAPVRHY